MRHLRIAMMGAAAWLAQCTLAQPQWRAALPAVRHSGYHTIVLSTEAVSRSKADLCDLRLLDSTGKEVPYHMERSPAVHDKWTLGLYELVRNERVGARTVVEMRVDSGTVVDELILRIRNARVRKSARITGSDDRHTWYMVQDERLCVGEGAEGTSALRFVDLPLSDYRWYRIELNDSLSAPVQVMDLGHNARVRSEGRYEEVPRTRFTRWQEGKDTRLALTAPWPILADRLVFDVHSEVPYLRQGSIRQRERHTQRVKRREVVHTVEQPVAEFRLTRTSRGRIVAPGTAMDTMHMLIQNGNDQPLDIRNIRAYQLQRRLVARLVAGSSYTITTGDPKAAVPQYDIVHYTDSLPASLSELRMSEMAPMNRAPTTGASTDLPVWWVWAAIIGIGVMVAIPAMRMLRSQP